LADAFLRHFRGGSGYTAIGGSLAFGSVSGSAPATVAAMGKMVFPEMQKAGFKDKFSLGLIASAAETSLLLPPSITFIIYGWMTGTSVAKLFLAGIVPGFVLAFAFAVLVWWEARKNGVSRGEKARWSERLQSNPRAGLGTRMPSVILGGI